MQRDFVSVCFCTPTALPDRAVALAEKFRLFRVEHSFAVRRGKWYFEFEAVTSGEMKVGWARPGCIPDLELGSDDQAFVFDGCKVGVRTGQLLLMPYEHIAIAYEQF